jgi:YesN/AraC family two-component response regulator
MYILDGELRGLNEGDVVILPPRVSFSFDSEDLGDEYNINLSATILRFDNAWLDAFLTAFPVARSMVLKVKELRNPVAVKGPKWIRMSALLEGLLSCDKTEQPVRIFKLLTQIAEDKDYILIKGMPESATQDVSQRREKIDRYIECNYCGRLSLEDISRYVGMSRTYFSIFFKTQYKEGFSDYLTRIRVEKASLMLLHTDKPIPVVASECGFKTVQYFTRAFKKVKGVTPGTFRKK